MNQYMTQLVSVQGLVAQNAPFLLVSSCHKSGVWVHVGGKPLELQFAIQNHDLKLSMFACSKLNCSMFSKIFWWRTSMYPGISANINQPPKPIFFTEQLSEQDLPKTSEPTYLAKKKKKQEKPTNPNANHVL